MGSGGVLGSCAIARGDDATLKMGVGCGGVR